MTMRHRVPYHPDFNFVAAKPMTLMGADLNVGDAIDKSTVHPRMMEKLWTQFKVNAVIPTLVIKPEQGGEGEESGEGENDPPPVVAEQAAAAPKGKKKGKEPAPVAPAATAPETVEQPAAVAPEAAPDYKLVPSFGKVQITNHGAVIFEAANLEDATAKMAELSAALAKE